MHISKRNLLFLILAVISFFAEMFLIQSFPPDTQLAVLRIKLPILVLFFGLVFLVIFSLVAFLLKSKLQGVLLAAFVVIYLLFRYFGFTKVLFQILLLLIFIAV